MPDTGKKSKKRPDNPGPSLNLCMFLSSIVVSKLKGSWPLQMSKGVHASSRLTV